MCAGYKIKRITEDRRHPESLPGAFYPFVPRGDPGFPAAGTGTSHLGFFDNLMMKDSDDMNRMPDWRICRRFRLSVLTSKRIGPFAGLCHMDEENRNLRDDSPEGEKMDQMTKKRAFAWTVATILAPLVIG